MTAPVDPSRRFNKDRRCPICGGAGTDPRGKGRRCSGFLSSDGTYAHCSREEHAGGLVAEQGDTYAHRLTGPCRCGTTHGTDSAHWRGVEVAYDYRDERGALLFQVVRLAGKGFRQRRPDGRAGWENTIARTRRVLYRLPELLAAPAGATVYIVEGEKDVDTLRKLGAIATCNPMGAGKWSHVEGARTALHGRRVVIIRDADEPGRAHAAQVALSLASSAASVRTVELPKKDVTDWIDAGGTLPELERIARADAGAAPSGFTVVDTPVTSAPADPEPDTAPADPEPLRRALPPAAPYPVEALGPILGPAVRDLHDVIQAPIALCAQSVLAAASLAVQPHADVEVDGRRAPLTLWAITIAASGERKSAVDRIALAAHIEREREQCDEHDKARAEHAAAKAAHDAALEVAKKGAKGAKSKSVPEIRAAIDECGPAPTEPPSPLLIVTEPTIEAVQKFYLTGAASLGIFADEGAVFLGGHSMSSENRTRTIGALSKLWDDGTTDRVRSGDGAAKLYGRRLALHLMIQPVIAEDVLGDRLLGGQGFLARALVCWPESTVGSRCYQHTDATSTRGVKAFSARVGELLRRPKPMQPDRIGTLEPRALSLSSEAHKVYVALHDRIERDQGAGGNYAQIRPWASKSAEQALRIAGVLAVIADPDARQVDRQTMEHAATLALYYLDEALRVIGTASIPKDVRDAEAILEWCRERGVGLVDSRRLLQYGPNRIANAAALTPAMGVLERTGWAVPEPGAIIDGKKARRAWLVRIDHDPAATLATVATDRAPGPSDDPERSDRSDRSGPSDAGTSGPSPAPAPVSWPYWSDDDDDDAEVVL